MVLESKRSRRRVVGVAPGDPKPREPLESAAPAPNTARGAPNFVPRDPEQPGHMAETAPRTRLRTDGRSARKKRRREPD